MRGGEFKKRAQKIEGSFFKVTMKVNLLKKCIQNNRFLYAIAGYKIIENDTE